MQLAKDDKIVFTSRIVRIETKRIRICDQIDIAAAKLPIRSGQVKIPVELLTDDVDENRILCFPEIRSPALPKAE